jgi:hypothetical protein
MRHTFWGELQVFCDGERYVIFMCRGPDSFVEGRLWDPAKTVYCTRGKTERKKKKKERKGKEKQDLLVTSSLDPFISDVVSSTYLHACVGEEFLTNVMWQVDNMFA